MSKVIRILEANGPTWIPADKIVGYRLRAGGDGKPQTVIRMINDIQYAWSGNHITEITAAIEGAIPVDAVVTMQPDPDEMLHLAGCSEPESQFVELLEGARAFRRFVASSLEEEQLRKILKSYKEYCKPFD